jgi:hypothetical protein
LDDAKTNGHANVPLIFVGGLSGTGKTALVKHAFWRDEEALHSADENTKCLFGSGKFDLPKDTTPGVVLSRALRQIKSAMVLSVDRWRYAELITEDSSQDERTKLFAIIPDLALLFDENEASPSSSSSLPPKVGYNHHYSKEWLEQVKFTIRSFIRTIAMADVPVCLHLDDVQWMDDF